MSDKPAKISEKSLAQGDFFDWNDLEAAGDGAEGDDARSDSLGERFLRRTRAARSAEREVAEDAHEIALPDRRRAKSGDSAKPGETSGAREGAGKGALTAPLSPAERRRRRKPGTALTRSVVKPLVDPQELVAREEQETRDREEAQRQADLLLVANRLARIIELLLRLRYGRRQEVEWSLRQALKTEREEFARVLKAKSSLGALVNEAFRGAYRLAAKQALAWFEHFDLENLDKYRKEIPRRSPFRLAEILDEGYWPDSEGLFPQQPLALRLKRGAIRLRDRIEGAFDRPEPHLRKDRNVVVYRRLRWAGVFNFVAMLLIVTVGIFGFGLSSGRIAMPVYSVPFEPLDLNGEDNYTQRWKIWRTGYDGAYCQQAMIDSGAKVKVLDDQRFSATCTKIDAVELRSLSAAGMKPVDTRCALAVQTYLWERRVVQPAAQKHFGVPVSEVLHFGSYNCRTMRGSNRMSQHARANAIDISGFRLKNGRIVSVAKHWNGKPEERAFLREVRDGACRRFSAVLSPEYNELHADHFHFDLGWWPKCK